MIELCIEILTDKQRVSTTRPLPPGKFHGPFTITPPNGEIILEVSVALVETAPPEPPRPIVGLDRFTLGLN